MDRKFVELPEEVERERPFVPSPINCVRIPGLDQHCRHKYIRIDEYGHQVWSVGRRRDVLRADLVNCAFYERLELLQSDDRISDLIFRALRSMRNIGRNGLPDESKVTHTCSRADSRGRSSTVSGHNPAYLTGTVAALSNGLLGS